MISAPVVGRLEDPAPRGHVRSAPKHRATLPLGHTAPDAPLHAVVERLGQALGPDRAAEADLLRPVLLSALDEKLVRRPDAPHLHGPIPLPRHAHTPPNVCASCCQIITGLTAR